MRMRITIKVMIFQDSLRQIVWFFTFFKIEARQIAAQPRFSATSNWNLAERERETTRKLQFSSLEGNHCKVFCAKQHPPSPSNHCFFQSQKSKHANRHVHVLCPSSNWPFLPPPWQQPLFTSRAGPTSIPLFINLNSPCPTLVIWLSFCGCLNSADMTKWKNVKCEEKNDLCMKFCSWIAHHCWHHVDCDLCQVWREGEGRPTLQPTHAKNPTFKSTWKPPTQSSGFKKEMDLESSYAQRNFSMEAKHFPEISLLRPQIKFLLVGRLVVAANKTATSHDDSEWHAVLRGNSSD